MSYGDTTQNSNRQHNKDEIERLATDITEGVLKNIHKQLKDDDINFSENLDNSFSESINEEGFHVVGTDNKYATLVENGMKPGTTPNFDALRYWVEKKLGVSTDESAEVTIKISNKIRTKGIPAKRFMKIAVKKFIGLHGKSNPPRGQTNKKKSGFGKSLKKAMKNLKKIIKGLKAVNRTINKMTKPLKKAYNKGVRSKQ